MLLDSRRLWIFVCVLSVDFLCDGSISSIHLCWEYVLLNKYWMLWKWLLIYFFVKNPSLCSGSILPDYTDADVFCFHNIICEWVALTRGHSGAFVVLLAFAHLYIKMHLLTVSYWSIEDIFTVYYCNVFCILPIMVILGSWWWGPWILLPRVQRSINLALCKIHGLGYISVWD